MHRLPTHVLGLVRRGAAGEIVLGKRSCLEDRLLEKACHGFGEPPTTRRGEAQIAWRAAACKAFSNGAPAAVASVQGAI